MRRFMLVPLAGLLTLAIAAPAAAGGPNVSNTSGSVSIAEASWDVDNNGVHSSGYASAYKDGDAEPWLEYSSSTGSYVLCEGGPGPEDDYEGFVGSFSFGYGPASVSFGRNFSSATASATVFVMTDVIDECAGIWEGGSEGELEIAIDLQATSGTIRSTGRESFHLPGEFNDRYSYRSTFRQAAGSVTLDGVEVEASGVIGKVSWSAHGNG